jgi:hypothetical protein
MYSQKSVDKSLQLIERALGWTPQYHTVAACDQAVDHFAIKYHRHQEEYGEGKDHLLSYDEEERKWIRNERAIAQVDYLYYATRYSFIQVDNQVIHYQPQLSQQIMNAVRARIEDLGWAIMLQVLKARQVGITTDSQIVISHRTLFYPNVVALTGSCDKDKSEIMLGKYRLLYENLPYWLRPDITRDRSGSFMNFGGLNSQLIVQHGRQMTGIGRGNTPTAVHLSELAEFENPEILIDAGLLPGIHESPEILFILESTANGPHNWWYKTWGYSKGNYWEGRAKFCPTFLPWFTRPDIYPTPGWLKQHPVPVDWSPLPVTVAHADRAYKSVRANDTLRAYFPENWRMAKEQMWYWEVNREEHRAKGMLDVFQREFCSDDMEAFTASGLSVFDVDVLSDYNNSCQEPKAVYAFRAREDVIPARFHPQDSEIDRSMKTIDMGRYQMVPVKWQGWEQTNVDGRFLLFEWPEEFEEYGLGVDTSDGIGKDRSVVEVIRKGSATRNDAQVGELASPYINAEDLAPMCHAIGLLYQNGRQRQPRIAVEIGRNGEITQLVLKKLGWSHFHNWVRYDRKKIEPGKAVRLGWITNSWSRPLMMDKLIKALRDGTLDINSREFVREMQSLHRDWDQQDARAEYNAFDDRIMALGIIYFSLHILDFTMPGKDVSYMKQQRTDEFAWRYKPTVYDDHEMKPIEEHGGNLILPAHPGSLSNDRSWEDYE